MNKEIIKALYEPFEIKERRGVGNQTFKYVPSEDIVDRMNKVFQGNWSTEVRKTESIEDQILMCVRVYARDPETNSEFWQDGYASHPLARYTSGQNAGKIIDIGNSYKSAMSKAIKVAVSKWGVGLYLELNEDTDTPIFHAPAMTKTSASEPYPAGQPGAQPKKVSAPPMDIPIEPKQQIVSVPKPPMGPPMGAGAPPMGPAFDGGQPKPRVNQPPVFAVENMEPVKKVNTGFDLPSGGSIERITDVQRVAIETIMNMHDISFEDLKQRALQRANNLPATIDEVAYLDAVTIIQYGNELRQV